MNWLGRVFVVLILIMSLVFMTLSLAVYATHKNWKDVIDGPNGLKAQLTAAQAENEQLKRDNMRRVEELTAETAAAEQQLRKLETERVALVERNSGLQTQLDQLRQDERQHIAAVAATQDNNTKLTAEVTGLRQQIRTEQQTRDQIFNRTLAATEELHQVAGQYEAAREMGEQLAREASGMASVMHAHGIDPKTDPSGVVPTVDGIVSQVRRSGGAQFVEVTIGADEGLKPGNTLEVFRGSKYLGRLDIVSTAPDKSVGKVNRRYLQGAIQEGDRVATRIQL